MSPKADEGRSELTPLQQAIMGILWAEGEATVLKVRDRLAAEREIAPNTVATLLKRLGERGLVAHRKEGRQFVYRAAVSRDRVGRGLVESLAENLYGGRAADLFAHLLDASSVTDGDLETIERLLAEARQRRG